MLDRHPLPRQLTINRRAFQCGAGGLTATALLGGTANAKTAATQPARKDLELQVGITTSSVGQQLAGRAKGRNFTLLELPRILRDDLDMRVIDLNTSSLASQQGAYLDRVRSAADAAGCLLTNLKLNQRGLDMNSADRNVREKALRTYEKSMEAAARLGLLWARPLPRKERPDWLRHVDSYRRLCDFGAKRKIQLLVENFGWMQSDADSVVKLVKAIGRNVAACPDTGNWNTDALRSAGLAKSFPLAVTCDFKARKLGPRGEHPLYDLKKCFSIGWKAGFRGPWCLEHANPDTKALIKELRQLREMLAGWIREARSEE